MGKPVFPYRQRPQMLSTRSFTVRQTKSPQPQAGRVYEAHGPPLQRVPAAQVHLRTIPRSPGETRLVLCWQPKRCPTRAAESEIILPPESYSGARFSPIEGHFQIETIVFRASAMLQGDRRGTQARGWVLALEVPLLKRSGIRKLSGATGYSVGVVANAGRRRPFQTPSGPPNSGLCSSQHPPILVNTTMGEASGVVYRQGEE